MQKNMQKETIWQEGYKEFGYV